MEKNVLLCGYSYHTHRTQRGNKNKGLATYLLRLQTEGSCVVHAEGQELTIEPGDLILLKPGSFYELRIGEHDKDKQAALSKVTSGDYYLYCRGAWVDDWWHRSVKPFRIRIGMTDVILSLWNQIIKEKQRLEDENSEMTEYLLRALCLALDRAINETRTSHSRWQTALHMRRYIEEHAREAFKVEDVARYACLSVSRAAHCFKEFYGKSIMQYALEIRLSDAVERMKHTNLTLEQIAESSGFASYTYFHRVFKNKFGLSPTAFRKQ
ncbi:helix-turn-helix domain-containing protein [Paenibacillus silviterrae]|uniref:helix-turn-helix domain-containing protein n=1 Tax=Paenibacillus silviterrae TaxID=3242194 RepID=UPI0025436DE8|nr:AraC family transcriptional regulator [Paenibacillus chinjuensis]